MSQVIIGTDTFPTCEGPSPGDPLASAVMRTQLTQLVSRTLYLLNRQPILLSAQFSSVPIPASPTPSVEVVRLTFPSLRTGDRLIARMDANMTNSGGSPITLYSTLVAYDSLAPHNFVPLARNISMDPASSASVQMQSIFTVPTDDVYQAGLYMQASDAGVQLMSGTFTVERWPA